MPKWFIRGFKDGPNGGYYMDLLRGKPGEIGERGDAYFVDDEALCKKCNNERLSLGAAIKGVLRRLCQGGKRSPGVWSLVLLLLHLAVLEGADVSPTSRR